MLATAFFVTSFGLAIVAKDRATGDPELAIPVPQVEQEMPSMESDLPPVEDELPTVITDPAASDELPELPETE